MELTTASIEKATELYAAEYGTAAAKRNEARIAKLARLVQTVGANVKISLKSEKVDFGYERYNSLTSGAVTVLGTTTKGRYTEIFYADYVADVQADTATATHMA